jgi:dynein heavy chain, axonemal
LVKVKDGVLLHGLFMEAFRWDAERGQITDAIRGEMIATLPMLHMEPRQNYVVDPTHYISPLYKTAARAGVLSTTGRLIGFPPCTAN